MTLESNIGYYHFSNTKPVKFYTIISVIKGHEGEHVLANN